MNSPDNNFSRLNRKRGKSRTDKILNILIALVVVGIIITASIIFLGGNSNNEADEGQVTSDDGNEIESPEEDTDKSNESVEETTPSGNDESKDDVDGAVVGEEDDELETDENLDAGSVTIESGDDEIIEKSIMDSGWQPIGTKQTGEHVSSYTKNTVDWIEKQEAIAYATGLPVDSMIYWRIENGGSPQDSVGIVSSTDLVEKYRVHLKWVDGKGWKPVKLDVLKTIDPWRN